MFKLWKMKNKRNRRNPFEPKPKVTFHCLQLLVLHSSPLPHPEVRITFCVALYSLLYTAHTLLTISTLQL